MAWHKPLNAEGPSAPSKENIWSMMDLGSKLWTAACQVLSVICFQAGASTFRGIPTLAGQCTSNSFCTPKQISSSFTSTLSSTHLLSRLTQRPQHHTP